MSVSLLFNLHLFGTVLLYTMFAHLSIGFSKFFQKIFLTQKSPAGQGKMPNEGQFLTSKT